MTTPSAAFGQPTITPLNQQLISAGQQGSVLLYNQSTSVTVYLTANRVLSASPDASPLPPLSSVVLDGSSDIWAYTISGNALLSVMPSATQFVPSVQTTQIFSGAGSVSIGGGQVSQLANLIDVSQYASIDISGIPLDVTANTTSRVLKFVFMWFDSLTATNPTFVEVWSVWVQSQARNDFANNFCGSLPNHGRYLSVLAVNDAPGSSSINLSSITGFGSTRSVPYSDFRQWVTDPEPKATFTIVTSTPIAIDGWPARGYDNMLCNAFVAAPVASTNYVFPFNLYSGPIAVTLICTGMTSNLGHTPLIEAFCDSEDYIVGNANQNVIWGGNNGSTAITQGNSGMLSATQSLSGVINLPRVPCALTLATPSSGGPTSIAVTAVAQQGA